MGPYDGVEAAQVQFADPGLRAELLEWHAQGVPLLEMADRLGIVLDPAIRAAVDGLTPDEVGTIRAAFVGEIERTGAGAAEWPVECNIVPVIGPVVVTAVEVQGRPIAKVDPAGP